MHVEKQMQEMIHKIFFLINRSSLRLRESMLLSAHFLNNVFI